MIETQNTQTIGTWYVSDTCIDCGMCPETAPFTFKRDDDRGQSVVYRQPVGSEENALVQEACEKCPTESILKNE